MKHSLALLVLSALGASACHQPQRREVADASTSSPDYRFELITFDLPLSLAERFSIITDTHDALLGMTIDETQGFEALEQLSKTDARVVRSERPACSIAPAAQGRIGARIGAGSLPSDRLAIELVPSHTSSWAAVDLDANIVWSGSDGSIINHFGANAPVPPGYRMKIFCLPAKHPGGGDPPAILAFFKTTPPSGSVSDPDSAPRCQKCADEKKK